MAASGANVQGARAYDYVFKLLLVGDSSVGKTCLLFRFCEDTFYSTFISTIGIDFKIKTIALEGKSIKLQIWDTAGQERFRTITTAYYRGAMGIIFVYDITNVQSFANLKMWLENVEEHASGNVERLIIGNKFDVPGKRQVTLDQANAFARPRGIRVTEVSAKTGENVEAAFIAIATEIKRKADQKSGATATQNQAQKTDGDKQAAGANVRLGSDSKESKSGDKCAC